MFLSFQAYLNLNLYTIYTWFTLPFCEYSIPLFQRNISSKDRRFFSLKNRSKRERIMRMRCVLTKWLTRTRLINQKAKLAAVKDVNIFQNYPGWCQRGERRRDDRWNSAWSSVRQDASRKRFRERNETLR